MESICGVEFNHFGELVIRNVLSREDESSWCLLGYSQNCKFIYLIQFKRLEILDVPRSLPTSTVLIGKILKKF